MKNLLLNSKLRPGKMKKAALVTRFNSIFCHTASKGDGETRRRSSKSMQLFKGSEGLS